MGREKNYPTYPRNTKSNDLWFCSHREEGTFLGTVSIPRRVITFVFTFFISFSLLYSQGGIHIRERVEIGGLEIRKALEAEGLRDSSITYTMPFTGQCWLTVWEFLLLSDDTTSLWVNGEKVCDDIMKQVFERSSVIPLGQFREGEEITFIMRHQNGDAWFVEQCGPGHSDYCSWSRGLDFSDEPICNQDFTGREIPYHIEIGVDFSRTTYEKYLSQDWEGLTKLFGERIELKAQYSGVCGGIFPLPAGTTFSFSITEGQEYAILRDVVTGEEGTTLNGLPQNNGGCTVALKMTYEEPSEPIYITVQAQTTANGVNVCSGRIKIKPTDLKIIPTKSTLLYGDTLRLDIWKKLKGGGLEKPEEEMYFDYMIVEGFDAGYLYLPDSSESGDFISGYYNSVNFAALEELSQEDSVSVLIKIEGRKLGSGGLLCSIPDESNEKKKEEYTSEIIRDDKKRIGRFSGRGKGVQNNKPQSNQVMESTLNTESEDLVGYVTIHVVKKAEILLGQSKYYYATEKDGRLTIHESTEGVLPPGAITRDIWGDNPVTVEVTDAIKSGRKSGVYWEKKGPDGTNLPAGMIRLIGRYWHKDSMYTVRLATGNYNPQASLVIEVKKPGKLGNTYNGTVKNVFGNEIVINDTIIKTAGIYGIPPQIIKGQIYKESDPKFAPCYRYEPWEDIKFQENNYKQYFGIGNNFVVDAVSMGKGPGIPNTHIYFPGKEYPKSPTTIRDYLADNPYQYIKRASLMFMNDETISKKWSEVFKQLKKKYPKLTQRELENKSLEMVMDSLRNKVCGKKEYDKIAQTRIMASYGFLQLTHYNATDLRLYGFTKNSATQPPEFLNDEAYTFPAYGERMIYYLKKKIGNSLPLNSWSKGYEKTWLEVLDTYNPYEPNYEKDVMDYSRNYLPAKGE